MSLTKWLILLVALAALGLGVVLYFQVVTPSQTAPRLHHAIKTPEEPKAVPEAPPKLPGGGRAGGHTIRSHESQESKE